jgi:lantibiotic modifying enzyme
MTYVVQFVSARSGRSETMPWQPLLTGTIKARAWDSIRAIVEDISAQEHSVSLDASLASGTTGLALLHGYLAQIESEHDHAALAWRRLQHAIAAVEDNPTSASLYSGLTGVGWVIAHLQDRLGGLDGEDDLAEIDEVLLKHLDQSPWTGNYDLIQGLVGFGVYALERLPRPAAIACLERVVDRLAETAEHQGDGLTWWTNPAWLPAETREQFPRGYYNLGLAHGVPGVIALLGQVCTAGVAVARARPLLEGAVSWLLANQGPGGFAHCVVAEEPDKPARLAWCYGDPGVAAALLGAARCVKEPARERQALAIARRATQRPPADAGVVDAGLCHGAAGLGHLFNRLYQASGEPWLAQAARSWLARTLEMRQPGRGIGGYEAWSPGDDGNLTWKAEPSLLTGAAGIALALLAATTTIEPAWDRTLLVAIPPAASNSK